MYESIEITENKARKIVSQSKDWEWVCEVKSTHGESDVYWNKVTGELIWMGYDGTSTYNKKPTGR